MTFENQAAAWGLDMPTFSNGSAYVDLDNDGDLDLVLNNVNMSASVYRNNSETLREDNHFLTVSLSGVRTTIHSLWEARLRFIRIITCNIKNWRQ